MTDKFVTCHYCDKNFYRSNRRINEAKRRGWSSFCSIVCLSKSKTEKVKLTCSRENCKQKYSRKYSQYIRVKLSFCSISCSARHYNLLKGKKKSKCFNANCNNFHLTKNKYCSKKCKHLKASKYSKKSILKDLNLFYEKHGRIPVKRELYGHYKAARSIFGTWTKAIVAAGFQPNSNMFADRHRAKDGHMCDSMSEKIIDDWLYDNKIEHETNSRYPGNNKFTVDFKAGKFWIEFFGLKSIRKYSEVMNRKLDLAHAHKISLIEIYPEDLFPYVMLDARLACLIDNKQICR